MVVVVGGGGGGVVVGLNFWYLCLSFYISTNAIYYTTTY